MSRLVATELLKLRTTRMWWGLLLVAVALVALIAGLNASFAGRSVAGGTPALPAPDQPSVLRGLYGGALGTGTVFALVIGILGMTGEYRHKTITPSLLAVPRRSRLVVAKILAYLLVGLGMGVVLTGTAVAAAGTAIVVRGYPLGLGADGVARTMALAVVGCGIWAVFGLGLGTLLRNQIAAVVAALASQLLLEQLLVFGLNLVPHGGQVAQFLPSAANTAMAGGDTAGLTEQLLPWWGGALTLTGWGLLFAVLGLLVTTRRDVT
jgi:ABC-2 type transport system permease protein